MLAKFNPNIRLIDKNMRITHIAGTKSNTEPNFIWKPVAANPSAEDVKAYDRTVMEDFRSAWADYWNTISLAGDPTEVALAMNPFNETKPRKFLLDLIEYPRYINPSDIVLIGDYRCSGKLSPDHRSSDDDPRHSPTDGSVIFGHCTEYFCRFVLQLGKKYRCYKCAINAIGRTNDLIGQLLTITGISSGELNALLAACEKAMEAFHELSMAIAERADIDQTDIRKIGEGVNYLTAEVKERKERNRKRGAANRAGSDDEVRCVRKTVNDNVHLALKKVHAKVVEGSQVLAACRHVCSHFRLAGRKPDELGRPVYEPLYNQSGKRMSPDTLARYYRNWRKETDRRNRRK